MRLLMTTATPLALVLALQLVVTGSLPAQAAAQVCATPQLAFGGANGTPVTTTHTTYVASSVTIGDVHVAMRIDHSWVGDIHLTLSSPAGTTLALQTGDGGNADDIDLIYADVGVPYDSQPFDFGCYMQAAGGSFSAFMNENAQGIWTLQLTDSYPSADDGILESWCLRFFTTPQTSVPSPIQSLSCQPTTDGANLSWINAALYGGIDIFVDGSLLTQLPGTATAYTITSQPTGIPFEIEVEATVTGGAPSCRVTCTVIPLGPLPPPRTEKLVLVVIDGLRYSEGLGDPTHANVPQMAALAAEGTIIVPFLNDANTHTSRAIPAIMCGSWDPPIPFFDPVCGEANQYSARPTVHEYFRQQRNRPASDCQYMEGPYCPWRGSYHASYGPAYWPQWVSTAGSDNDIWAATQVVIANDHPSFLTVYMYDVDSAGHSGVWGNYIAAIQNVDQIVGSLWSLLQAHPAYAGRTTMIVTNDHGRHTSNFQGHGDGCAGCRNIQLLAIGPTILRGHVSTVARTIPDITPTVGALLGFHTEFADGNVMSEIFAACQTDLGLAGPGNGILRVCGGDLSAGTTANIFFSGGPLSGTVYALASATLAPLPIVGGTVIDPGPDLILPYATTAAGTLFIPGLPGGGGPFTVYLQMVFVAPIAVPLPPHIAFSNAVQVDFLP